MTAAGTVPSTCCARIADRHPELRVIDFRRNYGQTAAMMAGFDHARGEIIVTLDADLQNDPADIPHAARQDSTKATTWCRAGARTARTPPSAAIFVSRIANALISSISGVKLQRLWLHAEGLSPRA